MKLTNSIRTGVAAFLVSSGLALGQEEALDLADIQFFSTSSITNFESSHVHPLDLSPDGRLLALCNSPEARVEFF